MPSIRAVLVGALLTGSALSSPAVGLEGKRDADKRTSCSKDKCLLGLLSLLPSPLGSLASKDCSSYFRTTVTPTPRTTTKTVVTTQTAPASTSAVLTTATTTVSTFTSATQVPYTVTFTETDTTVVETDDVTATTTTTTTSFSTDIVETDTVTAGATVTAFGKRDVTVRIPDVTGSATKVAARAAATTTSTCTIPKYASACSGPTFYSSACSCLGITHSTVTLAPSTVTVTATSTFHPSQQASTTTGTAVVSVVATTITTRSSEVDVTVTQIVSSTLTTTDATAVQTTTSTVEVSGTQTVTVQPTQTCGFQIQVAGGNSNGNFLQSQGDDGFVVFSNTPTTYNLDSSGQVYSSGGLILDVDASSYSFIDVNTDAEITSGGYSRLRCSIAADDTFTCHSDNGLNTFYFCSGSFADYPEISTSVPSGCSGLTLTAVPLC